MITTLHAPVIDRRGDEVQLTVQVTYAPGTIEPGSVSLRVRPADLAVADASVLPLVPAALVLACRVGQDLRVDEPLPPAVHEGARHVATLLRDWYGWRPAELIAPLGPAPVRPAWAHRRRGIGVFFTRGVDSWGTLLELLDGPKHRRPTHLITVDNEVHLSDEVRRTQVADTQEVADRLGLPLIVVTTDVRDLIDPHTDWGTATHGSVLAGIGLLLRGALQEVVIAPTHWTPLLRPWGSHPELDPAWSTPDLRVTHHDGGEPRWRRVERIVADPLAASSLHVCWQGTSSRNCGRCEKCLRLMTTLQLLGALDRCADRFDVAFEPERITPSVTVSPHPWCDTMDHLDHVGLAADPLRQRWERTPRVGRPMLFFQTRAVQPRVPVRCDATIPPEDRAASVTLLARRLASLGLRVDWERSDDGPRPGRGIGLSQTVDGLEAQPGGPVPALTLADLEPLLDALGADRTAIEPFDPDGQGPPPVVPEPPDWQAAPDPDAPSRK